MVSEASPPGGLAGVRPAIRSLPDSGIVELVNHGRERPGLIPLWVGESDRPTPAFIRDAAGRALRQGHTFYTHQRGIPPLREALARYLSALHRVPVATERIFVTVSGMQAILQTIQLLIDPGDEVVVISPVWPNIVQAVALQGGRAVQVPLAFAPGDHPAGPAAGGWRLDPGRLAAACGPRTKALFVNSPGNPTGWTLDRDTLLAVRDLARRRGLWLIADEVYSRLCYDRDPAPSFLEVMEPDERLIVVHSFSKAWAMTGWRIGWLVAPAALGQTYENLIQYNTSGVATFLQYAALAAVTEGEPFVRDLRERCRANRDLAFARLSTAPRVRLACPAGAFYLFFRLEGATDSRALALRLVDQARVGLAPGSAFGHGGEGFLRLCFAASSERVTEALDRLMPVLAEE